MAVSKTQKVTPARVPVSNINQFIRVPGYPPTSLAKALQEWPDLQLAQRQQADPETPKEYRWVREVIFPALDDPERQFKIPLTEQLYEVALYTRATKRFGDWMKANQHNPEASRFGA